MAPIPLTRAGQLIQVAASLEDMGVSPERVLRGAGLPMWHFCDPDDLIPSWHTYVFLEHAARAAGTEAFGLRVGQDRSFESLGAFGKAISRSLTTKHAVETFCRLVPRFSSASSFWLAEDGDGLWLCRRLGASIETGRRQMEQYALMHMIKAVRLGACPGWIPARIDLQSGRQPALEQTGALAGAEIRYRKAVTAIAIPREVLAREVLAREVHRRPRDTGASGKKSLDHLDSTAPARDFAGSVRQVAGTLLREGYPRIETVAEIARLPVRSLQRRLRAEGHSYSGLVDQARYLAARELLRDGGIGITEIALDVGYSDAANFNRAFRRWAGLTPRQFRRQQLQG